MTAVYSPDDLPLRRAPEKLISCAMCVGQQIKIRGSSKELSQLVAKSSGTSQDPSSGGMSSHMENIMAMNSKLTTVVLDKAKILDELVSLKMSDRDKTGFPQEWQWQQFWSGGSARLVECQSFTSSNRICTFAFAFNKSL